jgi:lipopolysaccharide export system protein LptA
MKKIILLGLLCLTCSFGAHAEKADATKPAELLYDFAVVDDVTQVSTYTGNVVFTRGTLIVKAGKAIVTKDPAGNQFLTLLAAPGSMATFRQKRDGGDLWVEGEAQRIEYDDKTDIAQFIWKARIRQFEGKRLTNEVEGGFISYNSRTEIFSVNAKTTAEPVQGTGRGRIFMPPKAPVESGK